MSEPAAYRAVVEALLAEGPEIVEGQMMGMPALKAGGKMFGGCFEERLVVKVGRERVAELMAAGRAEPFDPSGRDRAMKDWALLQPPGDDWAVLAREALGACR